MLSLSMYLSKLLLQSKGEDFLTLYPQTPHIYKKNISRENLIKDLSISSDFYPHKKINYSIKRVSRSTSLLPGSMTVEAAIAVPLALFFLVNVLSCFLFFHTYFSTLSDLHNTVRQLSMAAYSGAGLLEEGQMVSCSRVKTVRPVTPILGYPPLRIPVKCSMRAWTGYDGSAFSTDIHAAEEETYVYITENASVYHTNRECTHLLLKIQTASAGELSHLRNTSGARYKPCEKCIHSNSGSTTYLITPEGDRYHSTAACSGLKRTVTTVPLSQVSGLPPCSRCAH